MEMSLIMDSLKQDAGFLPAILTDNIQDKKNIFDIIVIKSALLLL